MDVVLEASLEAILTILERRPDIVKRLKLQFPPCRGAVQAPSGFMSVERYAAYRSVSARTVRYDLKEMFEGVHYNRPGRKRGRVVIDVEAADAWYAERSRSASTSSSVAQLAIDEVTRLRARAALNHKKKEK